jgi:hypothetical protein
MCSFPPPTSPPPFPAHLSITNQTLHTPSPQPGAANATFGGSADQAAPRRAGPSWLQRLRGAPAAAAAPAAAPAAAADEYQYAMPEGEAEDTVLVNEAGALGTSASDSAAPAFYAADGSAAVGSSAAAVADGYVADDAAAAALEAGLAQADDAASGGSVEDTVFVSADGADAIAASDIVIASDDAAPAVYGDAVELESAATAEGSSIPLPVPAEDSVQVPDITQEPGAAPAGVTAPAAGAPEDTAVEAEAAAALLAAESAPATPAAPAAAPKGGNAAAPAARAVGAVVLPAVVMIGALLM